jgi:adenylyl cyclase-associated protein
MEELPQVADYDFLVDTTLENFIIASQPLGVEMAELANLVKSAFMATRALIIYGLANPEPEKDHFVFHQYVTAIRNIVESKVKPPKDLVSHFAAVREAITSLSFMTIKPAPTQFIKDMIDCSKYYANRVLTENKGNERHILFVTKIEELFMELLQYVKKHYLTGFTYNKFPNMSAAVLPPPPPPPPAFCDDAASGDGPHVSTETARNALLSDLNKGSNITQMLKPVKRGDGFGDGPSKTTATKIATAVRSPAMKTYPPKFLLEGRKWLVEHIKDNSGLVINNESMSESVAIYKMESSNVEVKNKINNVTIDSCRQCGVSLNSVIACVELVRCDRVAITCNGHVPLISMDNCESVQVFLTEASRDVQIISAKCSSCNVCLLNADGSYKEVAMQEQIKTVVVGEQLISTVIEKK